MTLHKHAFKLSILVAAVIAASSQAAAAGAARTTAEVLAAAQPSDWRAVDAEDALYVDLPAGRVVIELIDEFAPRHAQNIRALVRARYFDGVAINRVQDNFVVQWGGGDSARPVGEAKNSLAPEFSRSAAGLPFVALPDPDTYAPQVGFVNGFPAARDGEQGKAWLVHCYGMLGVGRDNAADSGSGAELFVVTGHSPRQLDRNISVVGRVVQGMELFASLPRGRGTMGFYEEAQQPVRIQQVRIASDLPAEQRVAVEVLRTDTATFKDLIESRRNRSEEWYKVPAGRIDICNVPLPARKAPAAR